MTVAALYDVHGNLPALAAVLSDPRLADAEVIVSDGDLVMGPLPTECLDLLEADGRVRFLRGNGDREVCELDEDGDLVDAARWCSERLGRERLARVERWPSTVELEVSGLGAVLFCHATPTSVGFQLIEQCLEPPLLGRITAAEATDEFERRRRGA